MTCPLCDYKQFRPSWLGVLAYRGKEFTYVECLSCRSHYCHPMPDEETLSEMYGSDYRKAFPPLPTATGHGEPPHVIAWLNKLQGNVFVDYGCGAGQLLIEALRVNWTAIGVEFDEQVVKTVQEVTGARVVNNLHELGNKPIADVLNLGDVIEHLTQINYQFPAILRLIKPDGVLLAQGPLEGNLNLFTLGLRLSKLLRRSRPKEMPPYHVILATAEGQKRLFQRFGIETLEYAVCEVPWPAPAQLSFSEIKQPRLILLFILRRLSQAVSQFYPQKLGNRYFYAGRWRGSGARDGAS